MNTQIETIKPEELKRLAILDLAQRMKDLQAVVQTRRSVVYDNEDNTYSETAIEFIDIDQMKWDYIEKEPDKNGRSGSKEIVLYERKINLECGRGGETAFTQDIGFTTEQYDLLINPMPYRDKLFLESLFFNSMTILNQRLVDETNVEGLKQIRQDLENAYKSIIEDVLNNELWFSLEENCFPAKMNAPLLQFMEQTVQNLEANYSDTVKKSKLLHLVLEAILTAELCYDKKLASVYKSIAKDLNTLKMHIIKTDSFTDQDFELIQTKVADYKNLAQNPTDTKTITQLATMPQEEKTTDGFSWGKLIAALVLGTLAVSIIVASAIVLATSCGAATPLTMLGFVTATMLTAKLCLILNISGAIGLAAGVGLMAGSGVCTYQFFKQAPTAEPKPNQPNSESYTII